MEKKTIVYLMRHGETEENVAHVLQGHLPGKLTGKGVCQVEEAVNSLYGIDIDMIVSSDLQRCVDTTEIINRHVDSEVLYTRLLRERDWGSATGMVVDGVNGIVVPKDAESVKAMEARARTFVDFLMKMYGGKTVLVVSHGLFCRCLRAVLGGVGMADIDRMENADIVKIEI